MDIKKINAYVTQAPQKAPDQVVQRAPSEDKTSLGQESNVEADRVKFSRGYQEMAQAKKVMMSRGEVRADQVESVRNRVDSGTYSIKPGEIADRMLQEVW